MSPTPKSARPQHKRKARTFDRTQNHDAFRIEGSWNNRPDRPAATTTGDKRKARRIARDWAEQGAYVIVQENTGWHVWRTLYEVDGPALLAEREAEQALAAAGYPPVPPGYEPDAANRARTWLAHMEARAEAEQRARDAEQQRRRRLAAEATTHARTLMNPPAIVRPENRQRARHITGAQR
ncbi:hypothetical protein [Streptomyces levis]|uniref:hypothetical protein n=1 Tax=Streptomyces levis TaxID=285566 RepID=UPI003C7A7FC2